MMMASRLTIARTPIIGSEKKNTEVAPGAADPTNTRMMMAMRRIWREIGALGEHGQRILAQIVVVDDGAEREQQNGRGQEILAPCRRHATTSDSCVRTTPSMFCAPGT